AQTGTHGAQADDQTASDGYETHVGHDDSSIRKLDLEWWKGLVLSGTLPCCSACRLVMLVRLADVDQREHHEDERLQRDDQDVEDGPGEARKEVKPDAPDGERGTEQRDQHEDQLAGEHVAEESHPERHRL